ncbi:MAG TPA: prephenate dehydrogenase/arogenate dehydrogenase family protein [Candidatus Bilamarchaeaceae archaeon]|nr:prephenate dehydrogenase/arogenate dehydrogenase family protein [Candidatus Bilamarchaeaceae archaeon]
MHTSGQIAIIGNGRMGKWFSKYFEEHGLTVSLYGKNDPLDNISKVDYIMLAVTLGNMEQVIDAISKYVRKDQIVFDIASIKSHFIKRLEKLNCKIGSVHPMFGESAKGIEGQTVVIISDVGKEQKLIEELFKGAKITYMKYKDHDKMMAYSQVLPYVLNLAFGDVIKGKKIIEPPVYLMQKKVLEKIKEEEKMVRQIVELNPYRKEIIEKIRKKMEEIL